MFLILSFLSILYTASIPDFLSKKMPSTEFAISLRDTNGRLLYSYNADKLFSIASVNKLYTSIVATKYLGAGYRFTTEIYGNLSNGVVANLVIVGGADPLFVSESLWIMVNKLKSFGVREIKHITVDNSMFMPYKIADGDRAYSTTVYPFSFNFNSVALNFISGPNHRISFEPDLSIFMFKDNLRYCTNCRNYYKIKRKGNTFYLSGRMNTKDFSIKTLYRNVANPMRVFELVLRKYLHFVNIKLDSFDSSLRKVPRPALLFTVKSHRLESILTDMNRFSNNFIAELLFQKLKQSMFCHSINCITDLVKKYLGLYKAHLNMVDASGMSPLNKSSANVLSLLIYKMLNDFQYGLPVLNSLPVVGFDGTIKSVRSAVYFRAKTGTLANVKSYAGYFLHANKPYSFSVLANGKNALSLVKYIALIIEKLKSFIS